MPGRARGQIWRYAPEFRRPRHFHPELELNIVAAGHGAFGVGDAILRVAAGDLLSWLPGKDHLLVEASADFDMYVVGLRPELSARVLGPTSAWAYGGPVRLALSPKHLAALRARCTAPGNDEETVAVETRVGDLWRDAQRLRALATDVSPLTRRTVVSLLNRPDLGRAGLARLARTHPTEVSRRFHEDVGLTLRAYRMRLRLLRFIEAADGRANLLSASLAAGFGSYSQCHRVFRKVLGIAPSAFFATGVRERMELLFAT